MKDWKYQGTRELFHLSGHILVSDIGANGILDRPGPHQARALPGRFSDTFPDGGGDSDHPEEDPIEECLTREVVVQELTVSRDWRGFRLGFRIHGFQLQVLTGSGRL
jgi:hypothetical protein